MAFQLERVVRCKVEAPHLDTPALIEVREQHDHMYFEGKSSHQLARVLCEDGHSRKDVFKFVSVFKAIKDLRDVKANQLIGRNSKWYASKKCIASQLAISGDAMDLIVPSIAGVPLQPISVIISDPATSPWIRLDESTL